MQLTSSAFGEGQNIPAQYTCDSLDLSPPLAWDDLPENTASLALIVDDPDAPAGTWVHWVIYNIRPQLPGLPPDMPAGEQLPIGATQGKNDFGESGYGGPCPPPGQPHRYFFKLYALDTTLSRDAVQTKTDLLNAIDGHVLAEAQLMAVYKRG